MKTGSLVLFAAALAAPLPLLAESDALGLDEVLARHYEARGGLDRIKALEGYRQTGTIDMGGVQSPYTLETKRPDKLRLEFSVQGMTGIQVYDGDAGWQVMPFMGMFEPTAMNAEEARNFADQADIDGPLVDWQAKGHTVELVGSGEIDGAQAYELKVDLASGNAMNVWLDAERFLDLKWQTRTTMQGQPLTITTGFGDYRELDGLVLAHSVEQVFEGMPMRQTIAVTSYELDADIDEDRFTMPDTSTAESESESADD